MYCCGLQKPAKIRVVIPQLKTANPNPILNKNTVKRWASFPGRSALFNNLSVGLHY